MWEILDIDGNRVMIGTRKEVDDHYDLVDGYHKNWITRPVKTDDANGED